MPSSNEEMLLGHSSAARIAEVFIIPDLFSIVGFVARPEDFLGMVPSTRDSDNSADS